MVALVVAACTPGGVDDQTTTTAGAAVTPTTSSTAPTTTTTPPTTTTTLAPTTTTIGPLASLVWEEVADLGAFITGIEPHGDGLLVATKDGLIHEVTSAGDATVLHDLSGPVRNSGEQGLLDLALHPTDGRLFVHFTAGDGDTVLAELDESGEPVTLFRTRQPAANHNGGSIEFGPDGMLYLALGDGGASGDRFGNGQRTDTPLAAIHRFDVSAPGIGVAPPDNPGFEIDTIWAYGVRNPWRIAFADGPDGPLLIVADVGQNRREEITFLDATIGGQNLGWPIQEGRACYSRTPCDDPDLVMAQVDIAHGDDGTCSITGGEVYRGSLIPELVGQYVFSDFCGRYLRSVGPDFAVTEWDVEPLDGPAVIAAGSDGELLAGGAGGRLVRLVPRR